MKYVKILGLLAVAGAAMMALAASASATTITTTTGGSAATPTIHAVNELGHVSLHNPEANIECASTVEGTVERHSPTGTAGGNISNLSFTGCTNGWTVTVNSPGSLEVHWTSGHNGTLTSSGATVTATLNLFFFHVTCRYATNGTDIGTITGGNPATLDIEANIPFHGGSAACGEEPSAWTGKYITTSALYVAP
jgi:hypothetical protein